MVERFPGARRRSPDGEPEQPPAAGPVAVTNPLSSQHSVLRQSLVGSLLEVVSTNLRHGRDDVAIFEVGKGYGATGDGDRRTSGGGSASRSPAPPRPAAWNRPARPYDLDDAKGLRRAARAPARLRRPAVRAARPTSRTCTRAGPRASTAGGAARRPGRRAPSRRSSTALDLRAERVDRRRARDRRPRRRPSSADAAGRHARRAIPSSSATSRSSSPTTGRRPTSRRPSARHGGPLLRGVDLFDIYRGQPAGRRRARASPTGSSCATTSGR